MPGPSGSPAIEALTGAGVNVNVTLLFSVERYEQVIEAYIRGLERRLATGQPLDSLASVASFFVSRVDAKADALLPADSDLRGRVAVANAQRAYARYHRRFADDRWRTLADAGAHSQRPLWASTGTKDPAYSDVLYVEQLIAPEVINTMPEATLRAFADHGVVGPALGFDAGAAEETLRAAEDAGIDLRTLTAELEREGVRAVCDSWRPRALGCSPARARIRSASRRKRSRGGAGSPRRSGCASDSGRSPRSRRTPSGGRSRATGRKAPRSSRVVAGCRRNSSASLRLGGRPGPRRGWRKSSIST
jgi:hypothetical protein